VNILNIIKLVLLGGVVLTVFALGLSASMMDALYLFRKPKQLFKSFFSMYIVMPIFAVALVAAFNLSPAVEIALVCLAVSPIPPLLPRKVVDAGGSASYIISLLVSAALISIVFVPIAVKLLGKVLSIEAQISPMAIVKTVMITILIPLAAGIFVRHIKPAFAEKNAKNISLVAIVLLVIGILPVLFKVAPEIAVLMGNGTLIAIITFVFVGLFTGHLMGGHDPNERTALALITSSRHPGVALAIASVNFPDENLLAAAIVLCTLVNALISLLYIKWHTKWR
jgi:BASS family bile acid:Na+ symporter